MLALLIIIPVGLDGRVLHHHGCPLTPRDLRCHFDVREEFVFSLSDLGLVLGRPPAPEQLHGVHEPECIHVEDQDEGEALVEQVAVLAKRDILGPSVISVILVLNICVVNKSDEKATDHCLFDEGLQRGDARKRTLFALELLVELAESFGLLRVGALLRLLLRYGIHKLNMVPAILLPLGLDSEAAEALEADGEEAPEEVRAGAGEALLARGARHLLELHRRVGVFGPGFSPAHRLLQAVEIRPRAAERIRGRALGLGLGRRFRRRFRLADVDRVLGVLELLSPSPPHRHSCVSFSDASIMREV